MGLTVSWGTVWSLVKPAGGWGATVWLRRMINGSKHYSKSERIFVELATRFPYSELLFEANAPMTVGRAKRHEALSKTETQSEFKWGRPVARIVRPGMPGYDSCKNGVTWIGTESAGDSSWLHTSRR